MRAVIQRVTKAAVTVNGHAHAKIGNGLLVLLGIEDTDTDEDVEWLAGKIIHLRIFDDDQGVMNKSLVETGGELMLISQFTLHASTKKGNRPSYSRASKGPVAIPLYEKMLYHLEQLSGKKIANGVFGSDMQVELCNSGPVTIVIDTKNRE